MIHYSIIPDDIVFSGWDEMKKEYVELQGNGYILIVEPGDWGEGTLVQLISTNPQLFLQPSLQPGNKISLKTGLDFQQGN